MTEQQPSGPSDPAPAAAAGSPDQPQVLAGTPAAAEPDGHTTSLADLVDEPAKVMRIGTMLKQLLEEVRSAPLDEAARALQAGELVALMPQGTIPRGRAFFDPVLKGRTGAARLAAASRAPVVPVGMWGTEKVWPRSASMPHLLSLANPPTVRIRVGEPVELQYRSPAADTKRIMEAISDLLPPEAHVPHEPTEDELRATYPGGRLPG